VSLLLRLDHIDHSYMLYHRTMDKVDATMATVNEQRDLANEIADTISNPMYGNADIDEVSLDSHCGSETNTNYV
jgi:hypothetical protein